MSKTADNTVLWNEAAKLGLLLGGLSILCLLGKEWAGASGSTFLMQAAAILLWVVEFFGCILLMKKGMLDLRDRYDKVHMEHTRKLGTRAALLSGLLLASAQALLIMRMPTDSINELVGPLMEGMKLSAADKETLEAQIPKIPLYTFVFQWLYCWLYGTVLSSFLSRYIFLQRLFGQDGK